MLPKPIRAPKAKPRPIARRARLDRGAPPKRTRGPRAFRKSVAAAGKRAAWRELSRSVRAEHPICQACAARQSTDAAHLFSRARHPHLYLVRENLVALCRACHRRLGSASLRHVTPMEQLHRRIHGDAAFEHLASLARLTSSTRPRPACGMEETGRSGSDEPTIKGLSTA